MSWQTAPMRPWPTYPGNARWVNDDGTEVPLDLWYEGVDPVDGFNVFRVTKRGRPAGENWTICIGEMPEKTKVLGT